MQSETLKIFLVVSAYWVVSILTVFVNKALLSHIGLNAPMFIAFFQTVTSVLICCIMKVLNKTWPSVFSFPESSPFNNKTIKEVLPVSILFTMMIAMNNLCLKYVSVAFYYIGRSLTTIFNVLFTYFILGEKTSFRCLLFCAVILLGFYLGVDQESLAGSLSVAGTIFGVLASLSLSLYSVLTKKTLPSLKQEVWLLSYYNNIYSSIIFVPLIIINGELPNLWNYDRLLDPTFWLLMLVGGVCGFSIGFLTSLQIKVTSALTHNISGTAKACAQTILATYWNQETKSFLWWISNSIVLLGSAGYARTKQVEMESKKKIPVYQRLLNN